MATYKSSAGAILQPGNQINKLSGFNDEGVFGWPGVEAFELIGYAKVSNLSAAKASFKSFEKAVKAKGKKVDMTGIELISEPEPIQSKPTIGKHTKRLANEQVPQRGTIANRA